MQLGHGIMSGVSSLAHTDLALKEASFLCPALPWPGGRRWEECRQGGERTL